MTLKYFERCILTYNIKPFLFCFACFVLLSTDRVNILNPSKGLHNTEVTRYLTPQLSRKQLFWYKILWKIMVLFITLLLIPLEQKSVDYALWNRFLKFLEKSPFGPFCFKIDKFYNSQGNSNVNWGADSIPILVLKVSEDAFRIVLCHSLTVCMKNKT